MTVDQLIAVTGATGGVGGRVARRLSSEGALVRMVVRDPRRAPDLPGAELARAEYADGEAMRSALEGAPTLLLVSGSEAVDRLDHHVSAVDAAVAAGVERIVYLSFLAAAPDATFTFARDHFGTEEHIRSTGVSFTFLRDSLYADIVPYLVSTDDLVIRGPAGNGRVAWVTRDDVADVAAAVLTGTSHEGAAYDVTGPEALTMADTAQRLSEVVGREVVYHRETLEEARASRAGYGAPPWEVEGWVTSYAAIATGELDVVSGTVANVAGHEPQRLDEFLERNPDTWGHLLAAGT